MTRGNDFIFVKKVCRLSATSLSVTIFILTLVSAAAAQVNGQGPNPFQFEVESRRDFHGDQLAIKNRLRNIEHDAALHSNLPGKRPQSSALSNLGAGRIGPNNSTADGSFNGNVTDGPARPGAVAVQPDGKIVVGGSPLVNGLPSETIVRLNVDGTTDSSFNATISASVSAIRIQPDGKILIGGNTSAGRFTRLNPDGSLDQSFLPGSGPDNEVVDILILPDGKIMIAGYFTQFNGAPRFGSRDGQSRSSSSRRQATRHSEIFQAGCLPQTVSP